MDLFEFWGKANGDWSVWWATIDWGNAPGWLGAILTSASLFLAISLLWREQRKSDRAKADAFVTWVDTVKSIDELQKESWILSFHVYNSGISPIARAVLFGKRHSSLVSIGRFQNKPGSDVVIDPGTGTFIRLVFDFDPTPERFFIVFKDSSNTTWRRDLLSNRYLSHKQLLNAYWRSQTGGRYRRFASRLRDKGPNDPRLINDPAYQAIK